MNIIYALISDLLIFNESLSVVDTLAAATILTTTIFVALEKMKTKDEDAEMELRKLTDTNSSDFHSTNTSQVTRATSRIDAESRQSNL